MALLVAVFFAFNLGYIQLPDSLRNVSKVISHTEKSQPSPVLPAEEKTQETQQYYSPIVRKVQLEILNGCGVKGIADKLAALLDKKKYDVINKGNYLKRGKTFFKVKQTRVIDQMGKIENARELSEVMGVSEKNIDSYENPSPIADVTIIIGKDYSTLTIFK